jgi:hypothetical protein
VVIFVLCISNVVSTPRWELNQEIRGQPLVLHFSRHLRLLVLVCPYVYNIKPNPDLHQKRPVGLDFTAGKTTSPPASVKRLVVL